MNTSDLMSASRGNNQTADDDRFLAPEEARSNCQNILEMIGRLYGSANKLFVMTQLGSVAPSNQVSQM